MKKIIQTNTLQPITSLSKADVTGIEETLDILDFAVAVRQILDKYIGRKLDVIGLLVDITPLLDKAKRAYKDAKLVITVEMVDATNQELLIIESRVRQIVQNEAIVDIIAGQLRSLRGFLTLQKK